MKLTPQNVDVAKTVARDLVGLAGAASVVAGAGMIYAPAAFIIGGVGAVAWAFLTARMGV